MKQTKLHFRAAAAETARFYPELEALFEDDGFPLGILELEDGSGMQEISLYADGDVDAAEAAITSLLSRHDLHHTVQREILPEIDWVAISLDGLKPVRAGRIVVHGAHDRHRHAPSDIAIEIEAGLAFGTGHHGTTAGCLEVIQRVVRRERPRNALDLGTGSAVLAIALARLAPMPILATDIDPVAIRVARENTRLNSVAARIETRTATGFQDPVFARRGPFDLIVANILAKPLMQLAPQMAAHVTLGGSLVLSGILERQRNAVMAAYVGQSFRHVATLPLEGWVTIHLKR